MRVTFDSNVWQMAVTPGLASKTKCFADFVSIHDALRGKQIQGFISETVGTLEAIRNVVNVTQGQAVLKIDIGTTHDQFRIYDPQLRVAHIEEILQEALEQIGSSTRMAASSFGSNFGAI